MFHVGPKGLIRKDNGARLYLYIYIYISMYMHEGKKEENNVYSIDILFLFFDALFLFTCRGCFDIITIFVINIVLG